MATYTSGARAGGRGAATTLRFRTRYGLVLTVGLPDYLAFAAKRSGYNHAWEQVGAILERASSKLAQELQEALVDAFDETRVKERREASTGRLSRALADPRNRRVERYRFGVGDPKFLDRSDAKYWRQIDQGTMIHVGQVLWGAWGWGFTGQYARSRKGNVYAVPNGPFERHEAGRRNGKFMPYSKATRSSAMAMARAGKGGFMGDLRSVARKGVIRNEIREQQYFKRAWNDAKIQTRALQAMRQAISEVLGLPLSGVPRSRSGIRAFL